MTRFESYLREKRIDSGGFRAALPELWETFHTEFEASGEKAFDMRKKFYLNDLRLTFPLREPDQTN